jgi:hypothetical protein
MMVGAAASLLAAKATADDHLSVAERADAERDLSQLKWKYGSLRAALEAVAGGTETLGDFSAASAKAILGLQDQPDAGPDLPDDALLIYIGEWIERWCFENSAKVEDVQRAVEAQSELLKSVIAKVDQALNENQAAHEAKGRFAAGSAVWTIGGIFWGRSCPCVLRR